MKERIANLDGQQARIALLAIAEGKDLNDALAIAESYAKTEED